MRFHPARGLAAAGAIVAVLAATACSASSSSPSSSSSSTSAPPATSAPATTGSSAAGGTGGATASAGTGSNSAAVAQITTNWEKFFASSTPASERVALLQNGSTFSSALSSFASNPLAAGLAAKVTSVTVTSATKATVKYDLTGTGGTTLLANQTGTAVLEGGVWKVGDASFCGLLSLAGAALNLKVPAACSTS